MEHTNKELTESLLEMERNKSLRRMVIVTATRKGIGFLIITASFLLCLYLLSEFGSIGNPRTMMYVVVYSFVTSALGIVAFGYGKYIKSKGVVMFSVVSTISVTIIGVVLIIGYA